MKQGTHGRTFKLIMAATVCAAVAASCGKSSSDEKDTPDATETPGPDNKDAALTGGKIEMSVVQVGSLALSTGLNLTPSAFGETPVADLTSMKYYIQAIQLCESVEVQGSGYSQATGCMVVYQGDTTPDYDTFGYAEAKANTTGYVDLMNPEDVKRLSQSIQLSSSDARKYSYGFVNWYKPVKVTAKVPLNDGADTNLYTKDVEPKEITSGVDNYKSMASNVSNITTGPAEEAIVVLNNGGAWFKFAKPFEITTQDIADKVDFKLKLTFNPDGIITGQTGAGNMIRGSAGPFVDGSQGDYSMIVPMIALTPIVHKGSDKVMREKYMMHYAVGSDAFNVRVELYYLDSDATKAVYGASVAGLLSPTSTASAPLLHQVFSTEENDTDGVLLKNYQGHVFFNDFHRLTAVGNAPSPAKIVFGGGTCLNKHGDDCHQKADFEALEDVTYELVSVEEVK